MTLPTPEERADLALDKVRDHFYDLWTARAWVRADQMIAALVDRVRTLDAALTAANEDAAALADSIETWGNRYWKSRADQAIAAHRARLSDGAVATTPEDPDVRLP